MGNIVNRTIFKTKHLIRRTIFRSAYGVQQRWFKIGLILLVTIVVLTKNINVQFSIGNNNNKVPTATEQLTTGTPTAVNLVESTKKAPVIKQSAAAKRLSNLAFVMNADYAKRKNISPKVVAEKNQIVQNYLTRYAPVAVQEMTKYGIPASITLAQGLLESNVGDSRLARENNNHFGIKCFSKSCKKGHCSNHTDDSHKDFFRTYNSVWESYRAHSLFLQRNRYKHLGKLGSKDYENWAHGLRKAGYATDKRYAYKLISIIENLKLYQYDK